MALNLQDRIDLLVQLGTILSKEGVNNELLATAVTQAEIHNPWFSRENILFALEAWGNLLTEDNLEHWLKPYDLSRVEPKTVGMVTAGNIPLVGMHDFISVLITGHKALVKQSSNDRFLLPAMVEILKKIQPEIDDYITFTKHELKDFDVVIATGSNNTARYFQSYFDKYPHIIRKNRNAVAVVTGDETEGELEQLGEDIFRYYGLGCRSVSKIFVPDGYDLNKLFKAIYSQQDIIGHNKYKNNYDYNRAVYLMGGVPVLENGFVLFKEDAGYASPIAVLYYEYYKSLALLKTRLKTDAELIQCVVSTASIDGAIPPGKAQKPELWDYADGVDTVEFLIS